MLRQYPFLILLLLTVSCAKVQVSQDYDAAYQFSAPRTIGWNTKVTLRESGLLAKDQLLAERFKNSIEMAFSQGGYAFTSSPALLVDFEYQVVSRIVSDPVNTGVAFGYGRYGRMGGVGLNTGSSVRQYDQGRLFITLFSSSTSKQVWRGLGTREVFTHMKPADMDVAVDEMVHAILAQFPPEGK